MEKLFIFKSNKKNLNLKKDLIEEFTKKNLFFKEKH